MASIFCTCSRVFPGTEVGKLGKELLRGNDNEVRSDNEVSSPKETG